MKKDHLRDLIEQYANVYLFATKRLETLISEKVIPMSIEQFGMLRLLHNCGQLTPKEMAEKCGVHKSAITAKASRLVDKGLIERREHPDDRRYLYLTLTKDGIEIYLQSEQAMIDFISSFFTELDGEEVEVFLKVYEKINKLIEQKEEYEK